MSFQPPRSPADATPFGAARRGGRILLVDDQPDKLVIHDATLAPLGHDIVKARSGSEALRCLLQDDFAVILLDVNMPGMDGFETARLIRQRARNRHTPIIFITAFGDDLHAVEGYRLGAIDYILTPAAPEVLRSKVRVLLELCDRTLEVEQQAERLLSRTVQLQSLARASLLIHRALSIDQTLQIVVDSARTITGTSCATVLLAAGQYGIPDQRWAASPGPGAGTPAERASLEELRQTAARLVDPAVRATPQSALRSRRLSVACEAGAPPLAALSAPLQGREGANLGILLVAGKPDGEFSDDDEALLVQLAEMAASAIENNLLAEAREANRLKDEFLATLSHELRTPLSAILGWTQLLRLQALDPQETAEALEIIERNGKMQQKLIEDLLDVSRIVAGKMQLHVRPIGLSGVLRAAVGAILPAAQAKQIRLDLALDAADDCVVGDADRLQQAFWNLLTNALKFTAANGRIEVRTEAETGKLLIHVRDDGEGIAAEFLPYVFDRFRQGDNGVARKHGGLGIGLSVVRHIVELHGGSVHVASEGKGRGAAFTVTLPLSPAEEWTSDGLPAVQHDPAEYGRQPDQEPVAAPVHAP